MLMPVVDGLALARQIAADPTLASTRILMLTSGTGLAPHDLDETRIAGCLAKPVRHSELHDRLMVVAAPAQPTAAPAAAPIETPAAAPPADLLGRVLVAEDNKVNQMVACGLLPRLGYEFDVAATGAAAVAAVATRPYVAVLMDCHMPEMDGYEATGEIRSKEAPGQHLPIIAMTAGAMVEDRERCLAAGMDDYVSKPVNLATLKSALTTWAGLTAAAPAVPLQRAGEHPPVDGKAEAAVVQA